MINGVRTKTKKGPGKANLFQPASILDLVIYHNDMKNLQRLKEFKWSYLFRTISSEVRKNTVALFMVELLQKTIRQPEPNDSLYAFIEDALMHLDLAGEVVTGNFPIYFSLHLASFFGFQIRDNYSAGRTVLDLVNGSFVEGIPDHPHYLEAEVAEVAAHLLKVLRPEDLETVRIRSKVKTALLDGLMSFYSLQIPEFGTMRTLPVLREILS
jgi:DNA repair protein RecO (recombination protein O)